MSCATIACRKCAENSPVTYTYIYWSVFDYYSMHCWYMYIALYIIARRAHKAGNAPCIQRGLAVYTKNYTPNVAYIHVREPRVVCARIQACKMVSWAAWGPISSTREPFNWTTWNMDADSRAYTRSFVWNVGKIQAKRYRTLQCNIWFFWTVLFYHAAAASNVPMWSAHHQCMCHPLLNSINKLN